MTVSVIRQSDNQVMYTRNLKLSETLLNFPITGLTKGVLYYLQIESLYPDVRCTGSVIYVTGPPSQTLVNENTGGVRVEKLITNDGNGKTIIKRIYYSTKDNLNLTSGTIALQPVLFKSTYIKYSIACGGPTGTHYYTSFKQRNAYSNSLVNTYQFSQSNISYQSVVESLGGDNFENGGIEHNYIVQRDSYSRPLMGEDLMIGLKATNTGWLNGLENYTLYFRKNGESFIKLKEIVNHYKVDASASDELKGYVISKNFDYPDTGLPSLKLQGYEVNSYSFHSKWVYLDSTSTYEYDLNGLSPLLSQTQYIYSNPLNFQLSLTQTSTSDNKIVQTKYTYPHEMVSTGKDTSGVYQKMITRNIIALKIEETQIENGIQLAQTRVNYYEPYPNLFLPQFIEVKNGVEIFEPRVKFYKYDTKGNPICLSLEKGPKVCYIWDYNNEYPIAQVKNADTTAIAYSSFEANGKGNWIFDATRTVTDVTSPVGKKCYPLSTTPTQYISKGALSTSAQYIISYWVKNGTSLQITGATLGTPVTVKMLNGWTLYERTINNVSTINFFGTGFIDDVKLYPVEAQMATYTYDPLIGITSTTDVKGYTSYYIYDDFQRLKYIKDADGNILKESTYNYKP